MVRSQWNRRAQRIELGFLGIDNEFVVDLERCALAEPVLNEQLAQLRRNPPTRGGQKVVLRVAPAVSLESEKNKETEPFQDGVVLTPMGGSSDVEAL